MSCSSGGNNGGNSGGGGGQAGTPSLAANVVTPGNFSSGEQNASYSITVSNTGTAATSGAVTVVDPPTGFTVTAISGNGWSCTLSTTTCTRSDPLGAGQSFPAIFVTGNVTAANGTPVSIPLSLSGGGITAPVNSAPSVTVAAPALTITKTHTGNFSLGQQNATYAVTVKNGTSAGATNAKVTVTETVPSGETLVSMAGSGWTCPGTSGANTCDRTGTGSDMLATGASFPAITVTVNVSATATSPQTNQVSVSGGGMTGSAAGSDSTAISTPDLSITKSHTGSFTVGTNGTFSILVENVGAGPTSGAITVTDTLDSHFTFVSAFGSGWTCGAVGQVVTCTIPGPLAAGASSAAITLNVGISTSAMGTISNTATVATFGDSNTANNSSSDSVTFGPDLTITKSHTGSFAAGSDYVFDLAVSNVGNTPTTGQITVTDTLDSRLTFVSGTATGWTCGASSQVVTCTNPGPLAPGASAATIPLIVAVGTSATGTVSNTATVSTPGDTNASNNSSTDTFALVSAPPSITLNVPGAAAGGVIYAGGNSENVTITVANDQAGDTLTPTLTLNGTACTPINCGSIASPTGTSPNYTATYTPPASLTNPTTIALMVSSNLPNAFPATVNFTVYPAGTRVVKLQGVAGGSGAKNLSAFVFHDDLGGGTGATVKLLAAGYKCPGTVCGTLAPNGSPTSGTTGSAQGTTGIQVTIIPLTYTPPTAMPNSPYDRPMILAVSNADNTKLAQTNFVVTQNQVLGFFIGAGSRLNTTLTGGSPFTITTAFGIDSGANKTVTWTLTANGANCQPACGTLGAPAYFWNGGNVTASIVYTPPETVPSPPANQPVLTMTSVDAVTAGFQAMDSFQFQIIDGTCGTGSESLLNGPYAFLVQGGSAAQGYEVSLGSFTAHGDGSITAGSLDFNRTVGPITGLSITSAGSSYTLGSDHRGCLTLVNSNGGVATYRIAVGAIQSNLATQGRMIRFDDLTGAGQRLQGFLMKQDTNSFAIPANGSYAFGYQGVTGSGARLGVAGIYTASSSGTLSNFVTDAADGDGNVDTNDTTEPGGTYSTTVNATTGRGTSLANGVDSVFYVVNANEILSMTTDALSSSIPIVNGEIRKRTTTSYTQTSLDGNPYVLYQTAVDPSSGGNATAVTQVQIGPNGGVTGEQDVNDNGGLTSTAITDSLTIGTNGRMTSAGGTLVFYDIGTDSAFVLGTNTSVPFGYVDEQSASIDQTTLSGNYFFGGGAPVAGGSFDSGVANFNIAGPLSVTDDEASPFGVGSTPINLIYTVSSTPRPGAVAFQMGGPNVTFGYVISPNKAVFMSVGTSPTDPELFIGQQ